MTKQEIEARKAELIKKINEAKTEEELTELRKQAEELNKEVPLEENKTITREEERALISDIENLEQRKVEITNIISSKEERKVEKELNKDNVLKSEEYRSAWAKTLMCRNDFTEAEKRALDVALTTTANTYVAPSSGADGVNNGGLFIPETVSMEILKEIELESPFLRDIAKTYIRGLITLPYKKSGSGAEWAEEGKENKLESDEWGELTFAQMELSKTIRITWKLESMAIDQFVNYIISEVSREMREELADKPFYGTGVKEIAGVSLDGNNITAEYESTTTSLEAIKAGLALLPKRKRSGAKIYIAEDMALDIAFLKDDNGMYINNPVNGVGLESIAKYRVEVDPFLKDGEFVIGNPIWYKMNFNEGISVTKDIIGRSRVNDYTGYCVVGGAPVPNSFVYGKKKIRIDPEITNLIITPVNNLETPVTADTKVADLSVTGGTAPYTYSLKASTGDNAEFKISGTEVQANAEIATAGTKNITVIVTDSKQKTKEATAQIEIAEAGV